MKKIIFVLLLIIPIITFAEEEIISEETKYYKTTEVIPSNDSIEAMNNTLSITTEVTKEEYDASDELIDRNNIYVETTYKKLTIIISKPNNYNYRYKAKLHWKQMPQTRSYDIMGIGYYASVTPAVDPNFTQEYCYGEDNCYTNVTHYTKQTSSGVGVVFYLPGGSITSLDQTLIVTVTKTNPSSTIIHQKAIADYSHATQSISYANAKKFDIGIGGIILESSIISYYDAISCAEATWSGTW